MIAPYRSPLVALFLALCLQLYAAPVKGNLVPSLQAAKEATVKIMDNLLAMWEVEKYPNFLKAGWMPRASWEQLVNKFEHRILVASTSHANVNFTISFTGSSVTAGHDSPFNLSYPVLTGLTMAPAFAPLKINLISRNDAMGNNPCMPYDACVATFSGPNADIVHWEQQFNCYFDNDPRMVEQFIRQAMLMKSVPIVVIAGSITPNWGQDKCVNVPVYVKTPEEEAMLQLSKQGGQGRVKLITESNQNKRGNIHNFVRLAQMYPSAGLQHFDHSFYSPYMCLGPYIPTWGVGCASWHPSISGHRLRAHHYSYVWLSAWLAAIERVADAHNKKEKPSDMLARVEATMNTFTSDEAKLPRYLSSTQTISDRVQCLTEFDPHGDRDMTLHNYIVSGLAHADGGREDLQAGWNRNVLEMLLDPNIIAQAKRQGYLDYKRIIYANKASGPLVLKFDVKREGEIYLCEAPGVWGQLPKGFAHLWESGLQVFLAAESDPDPTSPQHLQAVARRDTDEICVHLQQRVKTPGSKIMTLVPVREDAKVMISTILIP
jgi:hypothetical protein